MSHFGRKRYVISRTIVYESGSGTSEQYLIGYNKLNEQKIQNDVPLEQFEKEEVRLNFHTSLAAINDYVKFESEEAAMEFINTMNVFNVPRTYKISTIVDVK